MSNYSLLHLNRAEYVKSIQAMGEDKALSFANMSLKWWDKQFGWYVKGCVVLVDKNTMHLSYIFYKIDKYNNYITIHNIFTPNAKRRLGYAYALLELIFTFAITQKVKRFRFSSTSKSLDFYLTFGIVYWGVNSIGDFYCDLPMPHNGLQGIKEMTSNTPVHILLGRSFKIILAKVEDNNHNLNNFKTLSYNSDVVKLKNSYLLSSLLESK